MEVTNYANNCSSNKTMQFTNELNNDFFCITKISIISVSYIIILFYGFLLNTLHLSFKY